LGPYTAGGVPRMKRSCVFGPGQFGPAGMTAIRNAGSRAHPIRWHSVLPSEGSVQQAPEQSSSSCSAAAALRRRSRYFAVGYRGTVGMRRVGTCRARTEWNVPEKRHQAGSGVRCERV
jgi:hypothetical protein